MIASHRQLVNGLNLEKIPAELRERPQWIAWMYDEAGRKIPLRVRGRGGRAAVNRPDEWGTFDEAVRYVNNMQALGAERGLGYVFTDDDPFCGVDLDGCVSPDGTIADWAREILGDLPTYAEISPSGKGIKLFGRGKLPPGIKHKHLWGDHEGIELFDQSKYFCVTADAIEGSPTEAQDIQLGLNTAIEKYNLLKSPKQKPNPRPAGPRHPIEASEERSDVIEALRYLDPSTHYDNWKSVGMALHDYDPGLLHEWDAWSAGSGKYEPGECEKKWASFSAGGGITIDTVFWMAGQAGWDRPFRRRQDYRAVGPMRLDARHLPPEPEHDPDQLDRDRQQAINEVMYETRPKSRCINPAFVPRTNGKKNPFVAVDCCGCGCDYCRTKHRIPPARERVNSVLKADAGEKLHYSNVSTLELTSLSKSLTREHQNAIRIAAPQALGFALVISDKPFPGSTEAPEWKIRERVKNQFWHLERSAPKKGQHLVTVFGEWRKLAPKPPKEAPAPEIVGEVWEVVPAAKSKALRQQAARELNLTVAYSDTAHSHGVTCGELLMPPGLTEDEHRELAFRWGGLNLSLERDYKKKNAYRFAPNEPCGVDSAGHDPPNKQDWWEI